MLVMCTATVEAGQMLYGPYYAQYTKTVDGDTFWMNIHIWPEQLVITKVRDRTIDTPEKRASSRYRPLECEKELAKQASAYAEKLMKGAKTIRLYDLGTGSYPNRKIATIFIDGESFGEKMIAAGYAIPYSKRRKEPWC